MLSLPKYTVTSAFAATLVTYHAFSTREQFFPSVHYLASSKVAIATFGNLAFATALCLYHLVTRIFLGQLRDAEVERINDRISQAVMETCLAMTIFREEFNVGFVAMFTVLTFIKVFHWLVQDRVDFIETTPSVSRMSHLRIISFMFLLLSVDTAFLQSTISKTMQKSASVHLLFGFEYVILASIVVSVFIKYTLSLIDNYLEGRWENKGVYVFYLELITDMLHLFVYLVFFIIVFTNYGLPLHLVRDLYWTARNFRNRVSDFLRYRRVTANMDERFQEATEEDLARCDNVCIICREEMLLSTRNKKLTCGHVFHLHCLRSWLERQQSCPTCRTSVLPADATPQQPAPQLPQEAEPQAQAGGAGVGANAEGVPAGPMAGVHGQQQAFPQNAQMTGYQGVGVGGQPGNNDLQAQAQAHAQAQAAWASAAGCYIWNPPQWGVPSSMALYMPAHHLQYAGQFMPQPANSQGMAALPVLPLILPTSMGSHNHGIVPPPHTASATEHRQHHQALSAATAAAAVATSIYGNPLMLPPSMLPPDSSTGRGRLAGGMSAQQRQEVAASAGGAVEQAVLTSLRIIEQQARQHTQGVATEHDASGSGSSGAGHPPAQQAVNEGASSDSPPPAAGDGASSSSVAPQAMESKTDAARLLPEGGEPH